jgi:hypothetical protein
LLDSRLVPGLGMIALALLLARDTAKANARRFLSSGG